MRVLIDGVCYDRVTPESEAWLEKAVQANCEHVFGPDSFYLDIKSLIKSKAGVGSIPDGYVIFFTPRPRWAVVEIELASHSVYNHLVPQLSRFNKGIADNTTRRQLVDILYNVFDQSEVLKAKLKQKIETGEVHKFLSDLVSQDPLIAVIIDEKTDEVAEAVENIRGDVQVVEFTTFRRAGISEDVNAFVFEPLSTGPGSPPQRGRPQGAGPEPQYSELSARGAPERGKPKIRRPRDGTYDSATIKLLEEGPKTFEELFGALLKEFPGWDAETARDTTKRRLHGYLKKKFGVNICRDKNGVYSINK